jgi:hypothetical protein
MTPPPGDETTDTATLNDATTRAFDERLRKLIAEKRASLPPEEFRKWAERLLTKFIGQEMILPAAGPEDHEGQE